MSKIIILGGSGYVGSHIISRLARDKNNSIIAFSRNKNPQVDTRQFQFVKFKSYPQTDAEMLYHIHDADIIINLIGTMDGNRKRATKAHVELVKHYAELAKQTNIKHFVHMSALGVSEKGGSLYFETKWQGEVALKETLKDSDIKISIIRPSFMFGHRAPSIDNLVRLINKCPLFMLPGAFTKFQPIYIDDVTQAVANILKTQENHEQTYDLVGPEVMTFLEMIRDVMRYSHLCRKKVIAMPSFFAYMLALTTGWFPKAPFTMNQYNSLKVDSISDTNNLPQLNIEPQSFQSVMSFEYKFGLQDRYENDRMTAGRNII